MPIDLESGIAPRLLPGEEPDHATGLAEWITEELLQRLYAMRQDLAEAAEGDPDGRARSEELRASLLEMIRRLRSVADLLRQEPAGRPTPTTEMLAAQVRAECREARRRLGVELPAVPRPRR
jgi:hypothetical protein